MSQQINLLVRKRGHSASAWAPMALPGLAVLLLLGLWVKDQGELATAQAAEAASAKRLQEANAALQSRIPQSGPDARTEITTLKSRAEAAQKLLAQADELGSQQGFARYFTALASVAEDGLWLTNVTLSRGGKSLGVSGLALRKESVMRYAQRLNTVFAREGLQFSALELGPESAGKPGSTVPRVDAVPFKLQQ